jgi:tetraacyldisaccharide 4'-kinase
LIVHVLSSMYGAAATWRRRWYSRDPARVRRLARPVISVGNLRVGGSGKTPVVAHLARLLLQRGERPSILSRGYARTRPKAGVTIVSDGERVLEGVAAAGDEPLMLARALPGVPVIVGTDRFASGFLAEQQLAITVHLLDDGFQHVRLARTVDLLLVDEGDLGDRVLPAGRLREPLGNAAAADAVLAAAGSQEAVLALAKRLGIVIGFALDRRMHPPRTLAGQPWSGGAGTRVVAFAGIARPERFFAGLGSVGCEAVETRAFPDHHSYTPRDLEALAARARALDITCLVTTEKDAVRLSNDDVSGLQRRGVALGVVPLSVTIEPADEFLAWLVPRLS